MEDKRKIGAGFVLGVTGGVGCGKSAVLAILEQEYGFHVIEADLVARRLMEPGEASYEAVRELFGERILAPDGTIDRPAFAKLLFSDEAARRKTDEAVHPRVWHAIEEELSAHSGGPCVVEAAIPAKEFRDKCGEMWYVYTSKEERIRRLMEGRGYTRARCEQMIASQSSEEEFRTFADSVIDNGGSPAQTREQIARLVARRTRGAAGK